MTSTQLKSFASVDCDVRFDNLTRQLYATDASIYQIEPLAVAFPKSPRQARAVVRAAAEGGVSVISRGAGTGLVGGAIGDGVVVDFSMHNRKISELNVEKKTVRVGAGVILDRLNQFLYPHGFRFGPDVATSSRATIGGMIANNSSGSHVPIYGTTADHISELQILLHDGSVEKIGAAHDYLPKQRSLLEDLIQFHALKIQESFPPGLLKRWPGYGLARCVHEPRNLNHILCGSEGTLCAILSAELKIVPLPKEKGLALIFFDSVADAMQATVELLDLRPAAIEHLDRVLFDQTRGQLEFQAARDLMELDSKPCEAILAVEFFDNVADKLAMLAQRNLGARKKIFQSQHEANLVWEVRKAGLNLLTGRKGDAKPVTCIEDAAVLPQKLPDYVKALQKLMKSLGLEASYYGHAAAGLLHVRPVLNLHTADGLEKLRQVSSEVSALVKQFKGSLAAEHGVGIARTEFLHEQLGDELMEVMREIKTSFDPHNLFNPGKIISDGRFKIDANLRISAGHELKLPFTPTLAFASRDESFTRNLEQCNGCGGCRKETATMCPTFIATGDEIMSTRGRANAVRAALELRGNPNGDALKSEELDAALSNCLSCKACTKECPSNVNMALLKAELNYARITRDGLTWQEKIFSSVDSLGQLGCKTPGLANKTLDWSWTRRLMEKFLGVSTQRPLPHYTKTRFDRWFAERTPSRVASRGRVVLWDDTFVRYHEPHIGFAAVKVLEAAGFEVALARGRKCCGRPAFSQGNLDEAMELGQHNLALLNQDVDNAPIIFLEPSCYSMFVEDYRELKLENFERVAKRCFLFEEVIESLLRNDPGALKFFPRSSNIIIHAHCHLKSLKNPEFLKNLAERLPERRVSLLETGCCGMAGAFGALSSKYELSVKIAEPLIQQVKEQPYGTIVVASGTSCRHQIDHLAPVRARHMAEVLAEALV